MSVRLVGYAYLALAMMVVGSTVVASKIIGSGLPVFTATALRFAIAFPCFLILMRVTGTRLPRLCKRDWLLLILQAGAGSVGYTTLLIAGMHLTSATDASVIIGTLPIVSAAIAIAVLGERPHASLLLAVLLAGAGVLSIAVTGDEGGMGGQHSLPGNALIFAAIVCEALFILLNKRLKTAIPALALSTVMTGLGLALSIIPALFEMPWQTPVTSEAVWAVVYYAIVPTVAGFLLWYAGAAKVSGSEAALFTALAPVSAALLAVMVLGEAVSASQITGIACVLLAIGGMALVEKKTKNLTTETQRHRDSTEILK
ncbi:DMT family transporter [Undibacterium pigrum]|uniref:Drug/metabolite transporter (DMT)-like permease n=1 Tax=Undibacterium pigrum TaxID=401470 RepID=A0A318IM06_9BURK|nr:DMT family transporter [Undibacterium pigrum]PXX34900.1 drug/metabolite transporter (DMT)-like permease [Undibacterium pigrum]